MFKIIDSCCGFLSISTDFMMVPKNGAMLSDMDLDFPDPEELNEFATPSLTLLMALNKIPGVGSIYIHPYELTVHIEGLFTSKTVLPLVDGILNILEPEFVVLN